MAKDKLKDNLQKGKLWVLITNFLSGVLFLWAYIQSENIWFLVASCSNLLVIIIAFIFFQKVEKRYSKLMNLKSQKLKDMYDK